MLKTVDFRSIRGDEENEDPSLAAQRAKELSRSIGRALQHSGPGNKTQSLELDISGLPEAVTDIFFVLSAHGAPLSSFSTAKLTLLDMVDNRKLTDMQATIADETAQAAVMSTMSRHGPCWLLSNIGVTSRGSYLDYAPVYEVVSHIQDSRFGHWQRRKTLVLLRVLHSKGRLKPFSESASARVLQQVLDLPAQLFMCVAKWL